jgi:hypothetical protein
MKGKSYSLIMIAGFLLVLAVPTCYFIAERDNPNDPENLNEFMGYPIADTGQTLCYDHLGGSIACDDIPTGYPRQDGFYADTPNARSFTGPTAHPTYTSDYTTKDNVTGLVWKSCSEGWDGAACGNDNADPNTYAWANALTACTALNSLHGGAGYAGRKTWRLPTVVELSTLPNYGDDNPAIDVLRFPNTQLDDYWSSSTYVDDAGDAWLVRFDYGVANNGGGKALDNYVRGVSDGPGGFVNGEA